MKLSIAKAAQILGVSITTLRRWDAEGKLKAERTPAGHRRYDLAKLQQLIGSSALVDEAGRLTAVYARIVDSSEHQQLDQQIEALQTYCRQRNWPFELFSDIGSDENGRLPGLTQLIKKLCTQQIDRLLLANHDRLSRSGLALLLALCGDCQVEVIITNSDCANTRPVKEIEADIARLLTVLGSD